MQEVKLRSGDLLKAGHHLSPAVRTSPRIAGRRDLATAGGDPSGKPPQHFGTATKANSMAMFGQPRQCVLHKGKKGFGFVLRGAKVSATAFSSYLPQIPAYGQGQFHEIFYSFFCQTTPVVSIINRRRQFCEILAGLVRGPDRMF